MAKKKSAGPEGGPGGAGEGGWLPADPLEVIPGVGPGRAAAFARLGVDRLGGLLFLLPRRYEEWQGVQRPASPLVGKIVVVEGEVVRADLRRFGRRRSVLKVHFRDPRWEAPLAALFFNQPYQAPRFTAGARFRLKGLLERAKVGWQLRVPKWEKVVPGGEPRLRVEGEGVAPVYPETEGLKSDFISRCLTRVLTAGVPERLTPAAPPATARELGLPPLAQALRRLHRPRPGEELEGFRRRVALEEAWGLLEGARRERERRGRRRGPRVLLDRRLEARIRARLPFALHRGQERAWAEIRRDLAAGRPMARLLQGDVGSGKTAVAVGAALACLASRWQVAFLAPTQVLAEQHHRTLAEWLAGARVAPELLTSAVPAAARRRVREGLAAGSVELVVGTHALLEKGCRFARLGLAVIDEQQRFGVEQRAALRRRGRDPHLLVLSATPIPRTLALTVYGGLDVSRIEGFPPWRKPVATRVVAGAGLEAALDDLRVVVEGEGQAFVVCPAIGTARQPETVVHTFHALCREFGPERVALAHGDQREEERELAFRRFREGRVPILAATTVVEVGVDVPRASLMVVLGAGRFGLATLHQLRGRVGRGGQEAHCLLCDPAEEEAERLRFLEKERDGFRVAEEDLRHRGPGNPGGVRQHGLASFRALRPLADMDLLEAARRHTGWETGLDAEP